MIVAGVIRRKWKRAGNNLTVRSSRANQERQPDSSFAVCGRVYGEARTSHGLNQADATDR